MYIEDYLSEAMSQTSAWNIGEQDFMSVALDYARQLNSETLETFSALPDYSPYAILRF